MIKIMKKQQYIKDINNINTISELNDIRDNFLSECKKRENKILVSNIINNITNFGGAKSVFESLIIPLMSKKEGKRIIKEYTNIIKCNNSLKTMFTFYEGLNNSKTSELKKVYITEALNIAPKINYSEYVKGVGDIVNVISESFKILGDDYVLEHVKCDEKSIMVSESLLFLTRTKKTIKNLNEYMEHIDRVSDIIVENKSNDIDVDLTLDKVVSEITKKDISNIEDIFTTNDKEKTFENEKKSCLEMIDAHKVNVNDSDVINKLNEIQDKLSKKHFTFETYTKDMLYIKELQELLK